MSGEVRPVGQVDKRIAEAAKLGFERIYISKFCNLPKDFKASLINFGEILIVELENIPQLVKMLF